MADEQATLDEARAAMEARDRKEQEIINLKWHLSSFDSEIGDYKVTKTYEARLKGEGDPYDTEKLLADRQACRDRINILQKELNE